MSLYNIHQKVDDELVTLLQQVGSPIKETAMAGAAQVAVALQEPLREAILNGDITNGIYEVTPLRPAAAPEYNLDIVTPGMEDEHIAYTIPSHGKLPQRIFEATYVMVPTFEVGNTGHILQKFARDARWDVMARLMNVVANGFVMKMNNDGWHALLAAGLDRNILVYDSDATQGLLTKRLVSLMKVTQRRNGGGNSTSLNRKRLTHMFVSPEGKEDMRNWGVDQVDDVTRREYHVAADGSMSKLYDIVLVDLDELGVGQAFQDYFTSDLGGSLQASDVELVVGLDLSPGKSFMMPVRENVSIIPDDSLIYERKVGFRGYAEYGIGILDNRDAILGSF